MLLPVPPARAIRGKPCNSQHPSTVCSRPGAGLLCTIKGLEQAKPKNARGETTYSAASVPERPRSHSLTSLQGLWVGCRFWWGLRGCLHCRNSWGKLSCPQMSCMKETVKQGRVWMRFCVKQPLLVPAGDRLLGQGALCSPKRDPSLPCLCNWLSPKLPPFLPHRSAGSARDTN